MTIKLISAKLIQCCFTSQNALAQLEFSQFDTVICSVPYRLYQTVTGTYRHSANYNELISPRSNVITAHARARLCHLHQGHSLTITNEYWYEHIWQWCEMWSWIINTISQHLSDGCVSFKLLVYSDNSLMSWMCTGTITKNAISMSQSHWEINCWAGGHWTSKCWVSIVTVWNI
jgi:hypothetical protein